MNNSIGTNNTSTYGTNRRNSIEVRSGNSVNQPVDRTAGRTSPQPQPPLIPPFVNNPEDNIKSEGKG